ncbi:hypothetical protein JCM10213_004082 [Rhodosporidiobolus nylandii]
MSASPSPSPSPSPPRWVPIASNRRGMAAVASAATLSVVCVLSLSVYMSLLLRRHLRKTKVDRANEETRAIKFLKSTHGMLLCNMLVGDLLQATGFLLNFNWVARNALPTSAYPTALCTAQAVLIQLGDLGSAFSSLVICANLFLILVFQIHPSVRVLWGVMAFEWIIIAIMAFLGPAALERDGIPFYGPSGGWCWMNGIYQKERLYLHYLWVFIVAFADLTLYGVMAAKIWLQRRAVGNEQVAGTQGVWRVMMAYPAVYIATILPVSCYRIASMAGHQWPIHYALAAGFIFTLSGTANVVIYSFTRSLVSFDSLGSALRRGSDALQQTRFGTRRLSLASTAIKPHIAPCFTLPSWGGGGGGKKSGGSTMSFGKWPSSEPGTYALNGVRVDVDMQVSSPELGYSPRQPAAPFTPAPATRGTGGARGAAPHIVQLRRSSVDGVMLEGQAGDRPFSTLKKLEEDEEGETSGGEGESRRGSEATTAFGEGEGRRGTSAERLV